LRPHGEYETSVTAMTGYKNTIWQFIVFVVLFYCCGTGDSKSDRNILEINNV